MSLVLPPIDMQFASRLHLGACNCAHKHSSVAKVSSKTFVVVSCALPARSSGVGCNNSSRLYGPRWRLCRSSWPMGVLAYLGLLAAMFCVGKSVVFVLREISDIIFGSQGNVAKTHTLGLKSNSKSKDWLSSVCIVDSWLGSAI